MLTGERPSVDILEAMQMGRIVIIPMPHRNLGGLGPLVGMLILQSIVAAAYARPGDALSRVTAPVFIDEVQVFIVNGQSPDLDQAFTQLRGFGVPLIVLHQGLAQLGELEATFRINAANRLILRTSEPDAATYATMYSQYGVTAEDIKGMEALHHQYAVTLGPNREQLVFSLRPNAWPVPPATHDLPPYLGPAQWQRVDGPVDPAWSADEREARHKMNQVLMALIYHDVTPAQYAHITGQLAVLPERAWAALLAQWEVLRAFHTTYLLEHPGAVPDQHTRQTWLSNLAASRGAILEEALTLRQQVRMQRSATPATPTLPPLPLHPTPPDGLPPPRIDIPDATTLGPATQRPRPEEMPEIGDDFDQA
jgi:hypothetical protein